MGAVSGAAGRDVSPEASMGMEGWAMTVKPLDLSTPMKALHTKLRIAMDALKCADRLASIEMERRETYHDSGLPLATEIYGLLDSLGVSWSHDQAQALAIFIRGRIDSGNRPLTSNPHIDAVTYAKEQVMSLERLDAEATPYERQLTRQIAAHWLAGYFAARPPMEEPQSVDAVDPVDGVAAK
jgi:hypothetical protein